MATVSIYVHDLRSSGVVRNAITLARRLSAEHDTTLIAGSAAGLFVDDAAAGPFRLAALDAAGPPASRIVNAARLHRFLRQQPPAVLISAGNLGHSAAFGGSRGLPRIARIYRISNEITRPNALRGWTRLQWVRRLLADADRTILVGAALARAEVFAGALAAGDAVMIPNGVDVARAEALAAAPTPHPWLGGPVPVVLAIGRLRPQKNFDVLIDAVGRARGERRLRLAIVGGGTYDEQARLRGLAAAAGLGDDFLLAGETANVFAWLARASVFALPSRWEGSSMALLEALACRVPVIASRGAGDASEVLADGGHGVLVDAADAAGLAAALLTQTGANPVAPGDRARAYDLARTMDAYAEVVAGVAADRSASMIIGSRRHREMQRPPAISRTDRRPLS